ncbi:MULTISPECIES: hypothetical protein [Burkholderiaceae]|uniref:hypothetical protein n=1 Tax=Burkholderiaceae TaxID=119060 RepID=UPI001FD2C32F|nr:hypothetical protein [Caballeronia sp. Lep1P3]
MAYWLTIVVPANVSFISTVSTISAFVAISATDVPATPDCGGSLEPFWVKW